MKIDWEEECFNNEDDEYDAVWHHKLGFMHVPNGDMIAFDVKKSETNPPVVYLSHDDGEEIVSDCENAKEYRKIIGLQI